jgi:PAS domain-containing protein
MGRAGESRKRGAASQAGRLDWSAPASSPLDPQPVDELAAIAASTDDAIVGTREGIISSWNPGAERLYGYRADEVIGRPITVLLPPEWPAGPTDLLERLRREQPRYLPAA